MSGLISYVRRGSVAEIVMDDGKANVMSPAMLEPLHTAVDRATQDGATSAGNMIQQDSDMKSKILRLLAVGPLAGPFATAHAGYSHTFIRAGDNPYSTSFVSSSTISRPRDLAITPFSAAGLTFNCDVSGEPGHVPGFPFRCLGAARRDGAAAGPPGLTQVREPLYLAQEPTRSHLTEPCTVGSEVPAANT